MLPLKPLRIFQFIPALLWFTLINVLISLPGKSLPKVGSWFNLFKMDKLIHMGLFAGLVLVLFLPFLKQGVDAGAKRKWLVYIFIFSFIWGIITELIQKFFIPDRSFDIIDITADVIGCIAGFLLCRLLLKRKNRIIG